MAQRSNYAGHHSDPRPTLPPIRDLFRDEFSRLERDEKPQYSPSLPFSQLQVVDNADRPDSSLANHKSSLRKGQPVHGRFDPRHPHPELYDYSQQSIPSGMASSGYAQPGRIEYSMSHPSLKPSDSRREPSYMSHSGSQEYAPYMQSSGMTSVAYPQASMRSYTKDHALVHQRSASVLTDVRMSSSTWNAASSSAYRTGDDERTPVARFVDSPPYGLVNIPHADVYQQEESMQGVGSKYDCPYCGKGFNRPSSLKIHLNSHTGEKPFACPVESCGRSFSVLSNMRRHARVHTVPADQEPPSGEPASSSASAARVHMRRRSSTSSSNASTISRRSRSISSNDDHTEWENLDKRLRRNIA